MHSSRASCLQDFTFFKINLTVWSILILFCEDSTYGVIVCWSVGRYRSVDICDYLDTFTVVGFSASYCMTNGHLSHARHVHGTPIVHGCLITCLSPVMNHSQVCAIAE